LPTDLYALRRRSEGGKASYRGSGRAIAHPSVCAAATELRGRSLLQEVWPRHRPPICMRCGDGVKGPKPPTGGLAAPLPSDLYALWHGVKRAKPTWDLPAPLPTDLYALRRRSEEGEASTEGVKGAKPPTDGVKGAKPPTDGVKGAKPPTGGLGVSPRFHFSSWEGGGVKFAFQHAVSGQRSVLEAS
jgi:hypothetical protein